VNNFRNRKINNFVCIVSPGDTFCHVSATYPLGEIGCVPWAGGYHTYRLMAQPIICAYKDDKDTDLQTVPRDLK
jgi:hypothetical protein